MLEVRLPTHLVGLAHPAAELVVEILLGPEDEMVDPVVAAEQLDLRESGGLELPFQPDVAHESVAPNAVHGREPHPDRPSSPIARTSAS
jgi:hypothetical protein